MARGIKKPLAAIDIGTNSFHLIVVDADPDTGRFKILDREKEIVRLGSGSTDMKYISDSAMNRGIETLKRFKLIVDVAGAPVRAIATSAVREALNQDVFIRRVKSETGIKVEIASGVEEARLIYLGVLQALPVFNRKILLIDIGGGSTEFLVGQERKIHYDNSVKLGAVRLTQRFFNSDKTTAKQVKRCREYILLMINPIIRALRAHNYATVVGTSGTINNIARMILAARGDGDLMTTLNNYSFSRDELHSVYEIILKAKDSKQRSKIEGLDPGRSDIILAGSILIEQIFKELNISSMTVSEYALREGIILDTIEKKFKRKDIHRLDDIRYGSVIHLGENLGYEEQHCHQVAALALRIFDQTKTLHHLGPTEREYLEAAAILHEVGAFLSHSQHHRHSYYLIRNAELLGFTENEKEIIANVARYHRKSHPKYKHEGFQKLTSDDRSIVLKLAAILRIADGLDRTHASLIADVLCKKSNKIMTFAIKRTNSSQLQMELLGADHKKELFEEIFELQVKFKVL